MTDHYEEANTVWPAELPAITAQEAARAARKLTRHFGKRKSGRVRRCWVRLKPPFNILRRGWRRLVHDVSHRVYRYEFKKRAGFGEHGAQHALLELEMVKYVIEHGWLNGALRSEPKPRPKRDRAAHARAMLVRWQSKVRRARTAEKKWATKVRYYERRAAPAPATLGA